MNAIETYNLVKEYPVAKSFGTFIRKKTNNECTLALDKVSLTVADSEVFGLLGPNGAGKTTLINILSTLVIPTAGSVCVGGLDAQKDSAGVRKLVGLVTSNERSFYWRLTGRQNLHFFAELYKVPSDEISASTDELLAALNIDYYADRRFDSYSTGIRQRFAVARALLHRPRILFMDEPTKGLDPNAAAGLLRLIRDRIVDIWHPAIIVTSHNLKDIEELCGRIAIMNKGRILLCGKIEELTHNIRAYEKYQLLIANMTEKCLGEIKQITGVKSIDKEESKNGCLNLEIKITRGGKALSSVLQKALSSGAEVHSCKFVPFSLTDVFLHVVSSSEEN